MAEQPTFRWVSALTSLRLGLSTRAVTLLTLDNYLSQHSKAISAKDPELLHNTKQGLTLLATFLEDNPDHGLTLADANALNGLAHNMIGCANLSNQEDFKTMASALQDAMTESGFSETMGILHEEIVKDTTAPPVASRPRNTRRRRPHRHR